MKVHRGSARRREGGEEGGEGGAREEREVYSLSYMVAVLWP